MTYRVDGRQYLVVAVGAGGQTNELVAFALPKTGFTLLQGPFFAD